MTLNSLQLSMLYDTGASYWLAAPHKIKIFSDHLNLNTGITTKDQPNNSTEVLELSKYDFEIHHIKGM